MKARAQIRSLAALLIAANMVVTSVSRAQFQAGYGGYGGMQGCPYPGGMAPGAADDDDDTKDAIEARKKDRQEKRDIEKQLIELKAKKKAAEKAIRGRISGDWAEVIIDHMTSGFNCKICGGSSGMAGGVIVPPPPPVIIAAPIAVHEPVAAPASCRSPSSCRRCTTTCGSAGSGGCATASSPRARTLSYSSI